MRVLYSLSVQRFSRNEELFRLTIIYHKKRPTLNLRKGWREGEGVKVAKGCETWGEGRCKKSTKRKISIYEGWMDGWMN